MYKILKKFLKRSTFLVELVKSNRSLFWAIKYDLHKAKWSLSRSQKIKKYLNSYKIRKLQIGSGQNLLKGWLNSDLNPEFKEFVFLDATKTFPFENNTFDYIFNEHLIEHLTYTEGTSMLNECYRVLKVGGKIRISTPSLEKLVGLFTSEKSESQKQFIKWTIDKYFPEVGIYKESFVINNSFRTWDHKFIYDYETLKNLMEQIGFTNITRSEPNKSKDENLQGIDFHGKVVSYDINQFETMVLEATK